ncbi:MAG TPA: serine/threonine-protein kinase [Pyrinomonadaceae bacterium]|jgi:serine/threonine protein kinase
MQAEDWKKVKEILREALQISQPERRRDFLNSAPSAEIRAEVESLLACETESEDFMSLSITDFSKDFFDGEEIPGDEREAQSAQGSPIGRKIGIYQIVGELGAGGMGAVYLAERADGKFARRVAVKMLRREFNTSKIRRRFEVEKEIQSRLEHPNIASLLDAGTTDDGVPFLVMEYIEGLAIDKFCRENSLSLEDRLRLFNKVCDAVAFAHRNLIIHRDLKPSNILVTKDGNVKLLDFGISKLLGAESDGMPPAATTILGAMTPEYAAPEQIKGETVTTAADIYALGVVLYKMLTGSHPFDLNGKTNGELLEIITNSEPVAPSQTRPRNVKERNRERGAPGLTSESSAAAASSAFSVALSFPLSRLKGDLDNIILKSLRKEPERRYRTVEQFSEDIRRFLDGLPVVARPSTFTYQASKFYRRNKMPVLAGAVILLSLLSGIAIALWQASEARGQAGIASEAQKQALADAERAEKISRFMGKVISYANPAWYAEGAKFGGEARVIDVIDDMSGKIDIEFAGQPDIQAELHHKFAEVYTFQSRNPARAETGAEKTLYHARRAIEFRKQFYGERHELVAKDMFYLYVAGGVPEDDKAGFLAEAIRMMRETNPNNLNLPYMLEAYTSNLMLPDREEYHEKFLREAIPPTAENKYQLAEKYLLEALPIFRRHYKEDNIAIFQNECKLAYAQAMQNKFAEAAPHYRICKESAAKLQNESHAKIIKKHISDIEEIFTANNFNF